MKDVAVHFHGLPHLKTLIHYFPRFTMTILPSLTSINAPATDDTLAILMTLPRLSHVSLTNDGANVMTAAAVTALVHARKDTLRHFSASRTWRHMLMYPCGGARRGGGKSSDDDDGDGSDGGKGNCSEVSVTDRTTAAPPCTRCYDRGDDDDDSAICSVLAPLFATGCIISWY